MSNLQHWDKHYGMRTQQDQTGYLGYPVDMDVITAKSLKSQK